MSHDTPSPTDFEWSELDGLAVDTARFLAMDAVEKVGNGHPGAAMSLAPAAYLLFQRHLRHDPAQPEWFGRDRFILSCGHASLILYCQLYLSGYGLELDDLKALRTWDSLTPGHPEWRWTPGVETTTGPLGQGVANAVGMAMAARRTRGLLDPAAPAGTSPFDHHVYVFASDGDLQEGVAAEASALAGTQQLGNLVVVWDDNRISIDDETQISTNESIVDRYRAYGWHVQEVSWVQADGGYVEDVAALDAALVAARAETGKPSLIALRTRIGYPSPTKQDTGKIHGAAAGAAEVRGAKLARGFDPDVTFAVEPGVLAHARQVAVRGRALRLAWAESLDTWRALNPKGADLYDRLRARRLPEGWRNHLPTFPAGKSMATRAASGAVLNAVKDALPELWGGSADLSESNNVVLNGEYSFFPTELSSKAFTGNPYGRVVHFGVREHAMGSILNGIALHGLTRPYGATFLVFSDYMRPAVRMAALMQLPVTYIWTHDSIGLGEDGPTHQPVEHLTVLRAIPGLSVVRPSDANETSVVWGEVLRRQSARVAAPVGLSLTRQAVPTYDRSEESRITPADGARRGGYILREALGGMPEVILIATGSEVAIALAGADLLEAEGVRVRVVAMPCLEWFNEQMPVYRDEVLPPTVRARVSVEAGLAMPWAGIVGDRGRSVSIEHFGASAAFEVLYEYFGVTPAGVAAAARESMEAAIA